MAETRPKLRITAQRNIILQELRKVDCHPTADEIYEMVRKRSPRISLGTVYRNLEILSSSGQIRKLEFAGSQKRFDGRTEQHYHVRCSSCGRVQDVGIRAFKGIDKKAATISGYHIVGHRLKFIGLCPDCQKKR